MRLGVRERMVKRRAHRRVRAETVCRLPYMYMYTCSASNRENTWRVRPTVKIRPQTRPHVDAAR